ncbi:MAG: response regulator [Gammaproteobacteria bacterium]
MAPNANAVHLRGTKILVAGGEQGFGQILKSKLRGMGFRYVVTVRTARDVLEHLASLRVDLLVAPVELPDLDAWRLTRMIRSGRFGPSTLPIVVVVSEDQPRPVLDAIAKDHDVPLVSTEDNADLLDTITLCLSGRRKRALLVVEDDERIAALINDSLCHGFEIDIRYDGESGLAVWRERRHELIILDLVLPRMSGTEVLHGIMDIERAQPVIILTGHATTERHQDLVMAGAVEFLAKPFEVEQLRQTCESVLRYSELMATCADFRETEGVMHQITNRVYAADRFLSMGKVWVAVNHLKEALRNEHHMPPAEDEWKKLVREFDT